MSDPKKPSTADSGLFPVSFEHRQEVVKVLMSLVRDHKENPGFALRASDKIATLSALNLKFEKKRNTEVRDNRFLEVARELGLEHCIQSEQRDDSESDDIQKTALKIAQSVGLEHIIADSPKKTEPDSEDQNESIS